MGKSKAKNKGKGKSLESIEENIQKLKQGVRGNTIKVHKKGKKKAKEANPDAIEEMQAKAAKLLKQKEIEFRQRVETPKPGDKDMKWYKNLQEKGTMKDKIMALSLIVKKDPDSGLDYLRSLLKLAYKKDRKQAFIAIDSLQELFGKTLLPNDRKLKTFKQSVEEAQEENVPVTEAKMIKFYHEHMLRGIYMDYVDHLGKCTNDSLDYFKKLAISILADCLMEKPEREETLLSMLINKLGDPSNEIAKHTIQNIIRILKRHGNMTAVFTGQIQQYIERVQNKSLYFFISCLNKIVFYEDDTDYISDVLKLYFSQFKRLNKGHETSHKNEILTLVLRGINNIASNLDPGTLEVTFNSIHEEVGLLFGLTNSDSFKVKIEALKLIFLFIKVEQSLNDKFYTTLYKVVGSLKNVAALKLDSTFALLYKALKKDTNVERVQAFFKRMIQVCYMNEISFVAATILLINEILKHRKELKGLLFSKDKLLDSDDEEVFVDADQKSKKRNKKAKEKKQEEEEESEEQEETKFSKEYNPSKKDPRYANADQTAFWELNILRNYYHPTIRIWTRNLMSGREIEYVGDPLQDFSMGNFLDKIILKPAKSKEKLEKMKYKKKRSARAEEIKEVVKTHLEEEDGDVATAQHKIAKTKDFRPDEEFLYKHLLLKSKKEKQSRQKELDNLGKKQQKAQEKEDEDVDKLNEGAEDFDMDGEDLPDDFFDGEEDLKDVEVEDQGYDKDVFQEAPSDSE